MGLEPGAFGASGDDRYAQELVHSLKSSKHMCHPNHDVSFPPSSVSDSSAVTPATTPLTSASSVLDQDAKLQDLDKYIALGCLHVKQELPIDIHTDDLSPEWVELLFSLLPDEVQQIIGINASRLLEASWIRLFLRRCPKFAQEQSGSILRVYLLPEDWGRRFIDRRSKSLKLALRELLPLIDVSPEIWFGTNYSSSNRHFDPWASAENVSLYYLFNKLPSPAPSPERVKNRYARNAVWGLLEAGSPVTKEGFEEHSVPGLKTKLYPYQARSAALMLQREASPHLQLDPRLEVRVSPAGSKFFFGARDGTFLQEPRFYETNRGGILAETMGLGKTIICLALILATKGHMPQIPPAYQPPPPRRTRVGSLADMSANIIGRSAIPGRVYLEQIEATENIDLQNCKRYLKQNLPCYEIPVELPRMNRTTQIPDPRQLLLCGGTIIVVPRQLLHQWQTEIRKHTVKGALRILVMDSKPKRAPKRTVSNDETNMMDMRSDLPLPTDLMSYDIILFTRNRFELEIQDGSDDLGRRPTAGVPLICDCSYIGSTRIRNCHCLTETGIYQSPLKKLHWLRIIIDEGHAFASGYSNAVLFAKQIQAERRWVVSGTPAKNLLGVEVDLPTLDQDQTDPMLRREFTVEQRKGFNLNDENTKAAKALGSLASNFLQVRPWSDSGTEGKLEWDDYIYRHEHHFRKTYSGFSTCFLQTIEGLVVKTRPEDVEKDIVLPPMRHRTVYLKPCWYDKMTANLFIQVLRANAITSERSDVDYLFHKNSVQARHSLIRNLRQSNFAWLGFSLEDVASTLETSTKYLSKEGKTCTVEDASSLLESSRIVSDLMKSKGWMALSKAHDVGMGVENWPSESKEYFALAYPEEPSLIGISQLLDAQSHVDSQVLLENPVEQLELVGQAARAKVMAMKETETVIKKSWEKETSELKLLKAGVPSSCISDRGGLTSRWISLNSSKDVSPKKPKKSTTSATPTGTATAQTETTEATRSATPVRPRKRRLTLADEKAELPKDSSLRRTRLVGTTSAKLTYLIQKVMKHQANEKIIIFYDGDNAAYWIAQCLEMLYINHRIYAKTLDNIKRSQYVASFNEDPQVRVLLIDVACGAHGLNLNAASVVLIVNPINRSDIEAQAIKRAHRIGQTKEVLVETLVLEGTIEQAIFKRARNMSSVEHAEAKTLEDDNQITSIIQNAQVIPITSEESHGLGQLAALDTPQQVFGRPGREKFHKFGHTTEAKSPEKPKKRARTMPIVTTKP